MVNKRNTPVINKSAVTPTIESPAVAETIVTATLDNVVSNFNLSANTYLGKADVVRLTAPHTFMRVSVYVQDKMITVLRKDVIMTVQTTLDGDIVLFKLDRLAYGESTPQGASALKNWKRFSESAETYYVGAVRDESGKISVVNVIKKVREGGITKHYETDVTFGGLVINSADKVEYADRVNRYLLRMMDNRKPQDKRIDDTAFVAYKKQQGAK